MITELVADREALLAFVVELFQEEFIGVFGAFPVDGTEIEQV